MRVRVKGTGQVVDVKWREDYLDEYGTPDIWQDTITRKFYKEIELDFSVSSTPAPIDWEARRWELAKEAYLRSPYYVTEQIDEEVDYFLELADKFTAAYKEKFGLTDK